MSRFARSLPLLQETGLAKLRKAHVLLLGLGGVGSYTAEALTRAGVGTLTIVDGDVFSESNLNRQLGALVNTIGRKKTDVTKERIGSIDPETTVHSIDRHLTPDDIPKLLDQPFDYVIDAIDDIKVKIALAITCTKRKLPLITCLGTGNKWDPSLLKITDIKKTHTDPIAKRMRRALKDHGVESLPVVFSEELPVKIDYEEDGRRPPASLPFVPPAAGILLAKACVCHLVEQTDKNSHG
ncbi:MAG TPA: tRNA threonylcarbamoyladenosine dehydratase [Fastidiosipila sp.]|jgi:tRNA A37 threonylcarbamoyladenosine dehydratase|nr:tRNA threonylcarbamoyladenosine dehydratase [Fastidiosipila sp.]